MRLPALLACLTLASLVLAGCTTGPFADRVSKPGSAAKALLDPREHAKLVVEIDHPSGSAPNSEAKALLKSTLQEITGRKADDIIFVEEAVIPSEPSKKYSFEEIIELEQQHRSRHTRGDEAALYIAYVAGGSTEDTSEGRVLGAAYRGTSLVMFKGNIREGAKGPPLVGPISTTPFSVEERCIERSVLVHELGHALGLVNLGTPMVRPHEDPNNQGHSSNRESVMWYAVENTQDLFAAFGSCADIPTEFDADDKADLAALRDS